MNNIQTEKNNKTDLVIIDETTMLSTKDIKNKHIVWGYDTDQTVLAKRLFCDCCNVFYDFVLTKENIESRFDFLCHLCDEIVREDLKSGEGIYDTPSGARNTLEEADEMQLTLDTFREKEECIEAASNDWSKQTPPTPDEVNDYLNSL